VINNWKKASQVNFKNVIAKGERWSDEEFKNEH
jgi:hypothetical protein